MGSSKSKVSKLNPKTINELQQNLDVDFTREVSRISVKPKEGNEQIENERILGGVP